MPFSCKKLVVIGAGLIGGSLIKALKYKHCEIGEIAVVGRNLAGLEQAKISGYIDSYTNDAATAVLGADVVIMGTPVGAMKDQFESIYANIDRNCIISDVGSVKNHVVETARETLKDKISQFVPAHPISGTEHSGFNASFPTLFEGRYTILTPLDENSLEDVCKIKCLWQQVGSQVIEMDSHSHDKIFAATSHLPHVLVYALMNTINQMENSEKYFQVVAGGFLDYTRIASSDAVMWRDVCLTNKAPLLEMIENYKTQLTELEQQIKAQDGSELYKRFTQAKEVRDQLVVKRQQERSIGKEDD